MDIHELSHQRLFRNPADTVKAQEAVLLYLADHQAQFIDMGKNEHGGFLRALAFECRGDISDAIDLNAVCQRFKSINHLLDHLVLQPGKRWYGCKVFQFGEDIFHCVSFYPTYILPPSATMISPLMKLERSLQRNSMTLATSTG